MSALPCFVVFGWFQTKKTSGILSDFQKNRQHLKICKVRSDPYFSEESSKTQLSQVTARRERGNGNTFVGLEHTRESSTGIFFESRPKVRERQTLPVIHPAENVHTSCSCVQKAKLQKTVVQV